MASSQDWSEYNGANAGTATNTRTEMNWKAVDDSTTAYSASNAVIVAGNNSMTKYQALRFTGTYNSLSAFVYKLSTLQPNDSSATSTRLNIAASVITASVGTTPSSTASGDPTYSGATSTYATVFTGTGVAASILPSTATTPWTTGAASTVAGAGASPATCFAQVLRTQLQTNAACAPGDIASVTVTAQWTES